ncbi:transcriptional regulator [Streptomyces sp. RS10V-4]|uniref:ScbA/BarX family gamma-butyrolactone biosynthesis protein n=1 Tax=Streptomyces rhizoryzae TaxID=2932493 RepID=UPI002006592D|nr:ScbA/BarX family gamma-butyrolactone biosynthesis protein [Streptomyces rhizoryzae]MCK7626413.1 transcriptional regulator [Streptomyces rhizoryzae]
MASATLTPYTRDQFGGGDGRLADGNRPRALTTTVPREYVHRTAVSEVFLTNWRRGGPGGWRVSAQWPRAHSFYGPAHGLHDPLLLIETVRQAGILLSHVAHGVPLDHPIVWQKVRYDLRPAALRAADTPADIQLQVTDREVVRRRKRLVSAHQEFRIRCDGADLAVAALEYSCHSPEVYRRLRGAYGDLALANARRLPPPRPVAPQLVGRERAGDVVLAPADRPGRWQLRVDTGHPVLFDHPVDHTPGMLMIEAVRQAARAAAPGPSLPVALACSFERYAELDAPCWVQARAGAAAGDGRCEVVVGAEQHGRRVLEARVASLPLPGGAPAP